mmetsp:Transcript_15847/g.40249  ORF Transcript_15847/g.40249 Transcript_15847/m.40249 type:complete len:468 (+) Transcript_15847:420-1823(+)|eukprot:jgi/Tetstr1/439804/TSEL_028216.t1
MFANMKVKMKRSLSKHLMGKEEEPDLSFIDGALTLLLNLNEAESNRLYDLITATQLKTLCKVALPVILREPNMLQLEAPIKVVGDVHGQYFDLLRILEAEGQPPDTTYLFLGDYVDRGSYGIEVMALLLIFKIKYPKNIYLLRGNHECDITSKIYGFCDQCLLRYNYRVWEKFCQVFDALPIAATVGKDFFCVHGGLSPGLESLDQITNIIRPGKILDGTLLSDLVWSDPDSTHTGWISGKRGISGTFGPDMVKGFLDKFGFRTIVRAHQVALAGYEYFGEEQELVTVFSAPNYCGTRNNNAAVMLIEADGSVDFHVFEPSNTLSREPSCETIMQFTDGEWQDASSGLDATAEEEDGEMGTGPGVGDDMAVSSVPSEVLDREVASAVRRSMDIQERVSLGSPIPSSSSLPSIDDDEPTPKSNSTTGAGNPAGSKLPWDAAGPDAGDLASRITDASSKLSDTKLGDGQ